MKICFLTTSFPRHRDDDAGIFIARLVEALSELGIKGSVVAPYDQGSVQIEMCYGWNILRIRYGIMGPGRLAYRSGIMPNLRANRLLALQIPSLLFALTLGAWRGSQQADLIHAHWLACAIPSKIVAWLRSKPLVVTIRGEDLKLLSVPILGCFLKFFLRGDTVLTTISEHFEKILHTHFPNNKIALVKNGISVFAGSIEEAKSVQRRFGLENKRYAIFAGRVIALKRVEILINLLSLSAHKDLVLVICGSLEDQNHLAHLKNVIKQKGLEDRVHFLNSVPPTHYGALLAGAALYWSASEYEGRPNAVLEAMAQGIVPIVSDIPAHQSLVTNAETGILLDETSLQESCRLVDELLTSPTLHQNMANKAKAVMQDSGWDVCARQYSELYKDLRPTVS